MGLTAEAIAGLLEPYRVAADEGMGGAGCAPVDWARVCGQLTVYLELILKWNARTNLTAIREPEEIVRRHFGESLFVGARLGECGTMLDYGSGAGFPGVPIQLLRRDVEVTLAESRGKKAAFLREVVRSLGLRSEVWADRVEAMPEGRQFDVVAMRAVDDMRAAVEGAARRAREGLMIVGTMDMVIDPAMASGFAVEDRVALPGSQRRALLILRRR